jgi:hypothetical protein
MSAAEAKRRFRAANLVASGWLRGDVAQPSNVRGRNLSLVPAERMGAIQAGCNPSGSQQPSP